MPVKPEDIDRIINIAQSVIDSPSDVDTKLRAAQILVSCAQYELAKEMQAAAMREDVIDEEVEVDDEENGEGAETGEIDMKQLEADIAKDME